MPGGDNDSTARGLPGQRRDAWIAASLALFTLAQVAFLAWHRALPAHLALQAWLLSGALALVLGQAWRMRPALPVHADMLLLMLAWGGFGMLWGWQIDGALGTMTAAPGAEMHAAASAGAPAAAHSHCTSGGPGGAVYQEWFRWLNAMNGLMLLFAFPPSVAWARCLQPYRRYPGRLVRALALDAAGMVLGMMAGGRLLGHPLGMISGAPALAHHVAMLAGMLAGMYVTMLLRRWLAPLPG